MFIGCSWIKVFSGLTVFNVFLSDVCIEISFAKVFDRLFCYRTLRGYSAVVFYEGPVVFKELLSVLL